MPKTRIFISSVQAEFTNERQALYEYILSDRPTTVQPTDQPTVVLPQEFSSTSVEVRNLIKVLDGEMSRTELRDILGLKHKGNFRDNYLEPALEQGYIQMKHPDSPNHPKQRYLLTKKGESLKYELKKK
jgi:ATP-dependent DNA helicase RecG